ncbi:N-acetylglucosamine kinase, partial [Morganella morganii]|nr:N-acetylglucosamine kinase [Morganella morganii]
MYYGFDMCLTNIELAVFNEALELVCQKRIAT